MNTYIITGYVGGIILFISVILAVKMTIDGIKMASECCGKHEE